MKIGKKNWKWGRSKRHRREKEEKTLKNDADQIKLITKNRLSAIFGSELVDKAFFLLRPKNAVFLSKKLIIWTFFESIYL